MPDPDDDLGFDWGRGKPELEPGERETSALDRATGRSALWWAGPGVPGLLIGLVALAKGSWGDAVTLLVCGGSLTGIGAWKYRRTGRL